MLTIITVSGRRIQLHCSFVLLVILFLGCSEKKQAHENRLQFAFSPYLKEHADNPVDWYEWGEEALARAKKENKPLLISIGYASCHWCHEMEKESFMDTAVARIMNEKFICIKVDREERPDIDQVYMNALQLLTGSGGWPLNAFALPDGKPFFAGTYYTKQNWINVLSEIAKAYQTKHALVVTQANALLNGMAEQDRLVIDSFPSTGNRPSSLQYTGLYKAIYEEADLVNGGLKASQKFPTPAFVEFLLQHFYITRQKESLQAAETSLRKMALGGIYDHVGGGFARYATDSIWRVPHFEKMLYDNAQMISVYAHAYQVTNDAFFKNVMTATIGFIEQTLAAPGGGYFSSLNADTKAGEGVFYTWSKEDFIKTTGGEVSVSDYFHVSQEGNWKPGANILYADKTPEEFAIDRKLQPGRFNEQIAAARAALYRARSQREQPTIDTKIITAWNCIMIKAFADAYAATGLDTYLDKANACAAFVEKNLVKQDGSIRRHFNDGKGNIEGFLDDYAWAATAFTRLYEVNFDQHWLGLAKRVTDYAISNFWNEKTGVFFYSGKSNTLVLRKTELADDAIPSSNALFAKLLNTLGALYADSTYTSKALTMFGSVFERIKKEPRYYIQWCSLAALLSSKSYEIAIVGKDAIKKNKELQLVFLPTSIILGSVKEEYLPLLQFKSVAGKTLIYVCTDKVCKRPEEQVTKALLQVK
jgi:uncharacterized protein YyaL (SSP411 family)